MRVVDKNFRKLTYALMFFLIVLRVENVFAGDGKIFPRDGYIPDAETAVKVAETILVRFYGPSIEQQKPLTSKLIAGRWVIEGRMPQKKGEIVAGGVAHIEISKADGRMSNLFHGK